MGETKVLSKLEELENRALQLIIEKGTEGIMQSDLWRILNSSSREISRICLKLEDKKVIKRERELSKGRWTYRIFTNKKPVEIESLLDIPCVSCPNLYRCEMGEESHINSCKILTQWLLTYQEQALKEEST